MNLLAKMFDEESRLFPFSTRLKEGRYVNDFHNEGKYRYTVNVFVALQRLEHYSNSPFDLVKLVDNYVARHLSQDLSVANRGLLLHVLSLMNHKAAREIYHWLSYKLENRAKALRYSLQDIAWSSFGATTYASRLKEGKACDLATKLLSYLRQDFMNPATLLPRNNHSLRGVFVSFGGIVYYLMALDHFARTFEDDTTITLFKDAVRQVLSLQGEHGEWPWFIDSATGRIMDWYQLYSVHQDAMALLFLLPAFDLGVEGSRAAICRSYKWLLGDNQLRIPLIQERPFIIYRSIRQKQFAERPMRFKRSIANKTLGRSAQLLDPDALEINKECRSYHLGWIVYVWAGRPDFADFVGSICEPGSPERDFSRFKTVLLGSNPALIQIHDKNQQSSVDYKYSNALSHSSV